MHSRDHNEKKKNFRAVNKQLLISSDQRKSKKIRKRYNVCNRIWCSYITITHDEVYNKRLKSMKKNNKF